MLPGIEMMGCSGLAVPDEVMHHVVKVESSYNPYAIGVVGGHLVRQPRNLSEAVATVRMLVERGYNFSLGLAQVNRYNLSKYGLDTYEKAFEKCANLQAGSRILAECNNRAKGDWGKAFSCYYSGNFTTGFRHGYVQKVVTSWRAQAGQGALPIPVVDRRKGKARSPAPMPATASRAMPAADSLLQRRIQPLMQPAVQSQQGALSVQQQAGSMRQEPPGSGAGAYPAPATPLLQEAPVQVQLVGAPASAPTANNLKGSAGKPQPAENHVDNAFVF